MLAKNKDILFRLGLGSIFVVHSGWAWLASDEFRDILHANSITARIGHQDVLIWLICINDGLLSLLILSGMRRKAATIWGCSWLVLAILVTGFWTTDFIEHVGIISLLLYYGVTKNPASAR